MREGWIWDPERVAVSQPRNYCFLPVDMLVRGPSPAGICSTNCKERQKGWKEGSDVFRRRLTGTG